MNQDHIFIDVASDQDGISGIAMVRTDRKGKVLCAFSDNVDDTSPISKVVEAMRTSILKPELGNTYVIVAHFAEADKQVLKDAGQGDLFRGRAWLDTSQIAWPFVYNDLAGERTLDALCAYFEIKNTAPDTATGDCEALVRLYWEMMKRYKTAILGEEAIRDYGGETLKRLRSVIGI